MLYVTRRKTDDCDDCIPLSPLLHLGPDAVLIKFVVKTETYAGLMRVQCDACREMIRPQGIAVLRGAGERVGNREKEDHVMITTTMQVLDVCWTTSRMAWNQ